MLTKIDFFFLFQTLEVWVLSSPQANTVNHSLIDVPPTGIDLPLLSMVKLSNYHI
ncbi:MAG: hypothetical protein ACKO11_05700 [Cuspidothrix sp.]